MTNKFIGISNSVKPPYKSTSLLLRRSFYVRDVNHKFTMSVIGLGIESLVYERHRHRYEFNNDYREVLIKHGLTLSGVSPDDKLVEAVELSDRPFFVGVQHHPEFKSRPNKPHPLFLGFVGAAFKNQKA